MEFFCAEVKKKYEYIILEAGEAVLSLMRKYLHRGTKSSSWLRYWTMRYVQHMYNRLIKLS